jgi:uncharacterized membrane protein YgcG
VWVDWYGWTWVSYDPWGWAPYHYGRWYVNPTYGWCWYPGGFGGRHYWSPGLVAFVGFGGGFGHVGWVPLAPREPYYRWYGRGFYGGGNNIRVASNINIYSNYRNAHFANAVTAVDGAGFARGSMGRAWRAGDGDLQRATLVRGQLPVAPGRESLRLSDREVRGNISSRVPETQRFVSRRQAPQVERVPFEQQRRNIETGQAFTRSPQQPAPGGASPDRQSWRRFGEPTGGSAVRTDRGAPPPQQAPQNNGGQRGGWGGFGQPAGPAVDRSMYRAQQPQAAAPPRSENFRQAETPNAAPARPYVAPQGNRNTLARPSVSAPARSAPPEAVRISPSVVRERPAQRQESAPAFRSAPRAEPARPSGGNGGGGGRREGGGNGGGNGGGGRQSGGGGHGRR